MTHELIEFIHIPKCGGTFIKNFIGPDSQDAKDTDLTCKMYRKKHGDCTSLHLSFEELRMRNVKKFFVAVVRDPCTRLASNYHYDIDVWKKIFGEKVCATFETFVSFLCDNPQMIYKHIHLFPQSHFLLESRKGSNSISKDIHIFSFDQLPMNIFYFCCQLRIPVKKSNLCKHFNNQDIIYDINEITRQKIEKIYSSDYMLLSNYF